jgi:hypothetical protein
MDPTGAQVPRLRHPRPPLPCEGLQRGGPGRLHLLSSHTHSLALLVGG